MKQKSEATGVLFGVAGAALFAVAVYAGVSFIEAPHPSSRREVANGAPARASAAEGQGRLTLDPNLFQGQVKQAYQIADRRPSLLAQMHCYCGCDRTNNHKNLLDCFRDTHGSRCEICVGEALEADQLAKQGMPIDQIRDALRERFAHRE